MEQHYKFEKKLETPANDVPESLPEGWIENITEAQKEAYRIRLMASAEKMKSEGVSNSAPWSKD